MSVKAKANPKTTRKITTIIAKAPRIIPINDKDFADFA
jgi:hypothetical protein